MLLLIQTRRFLINALIIGIIIVMFVYTNDMLRFGWQLWTGKHIKWHGSTIEMGRDHFVFPMGHSDTLMIGRFDNSNEIFPSDNYLIIGSAKVKFDLNHLPDVLPKFCKKIGCREYKAYSSTGNGVLMDCVEFKGVADVLNNREFHVFCKAQGSDTLVEYHGITEEYSKFVEQQQKVIESIARARVETMQHLAR